MVQNKFQVTPRLGVQGPRKMGEVQIQKKGNPKNHRSKNKGKGNLCWKFSKSTKLHGKKIGAEKKENQIA